MARPLLSVDWSPSAVVKHRFVVAAHPNPGQLLLARWRTCSMSAPLAEIPCRIENVRDNLGDEVFVREQRLLFGVRSNLDEVATSQAGLLPSRSRIPPRMAIFPELDIHGRLPERRLCPNVRQ